MVTDTCKSLITYEDIGDILTEPFRQQRQDKVTAMFNEGKTATSNNAVMPPNAEEDWQNWEAFYSVNPAPRSWVDRAAAQEFIDWVVATAPTHNIVITSTAIEDL